MKPAFSVLYTQLFCNLPYMPNNIYIGVLTCYFCALKQKYLNNTCRILYIYYEFPLANIVIWYKK